jgi:uncharacterized protein (DUF1800 family)
VLLTATVHSPATLLWLDADKNVAAHPNENLGRELLELFTLAVGNYTEADVQAAARALTGWRVASDEFRFNRERHDESEKTILGQTQNFDGDGLLALLVAQPATARRVAWRIGRMLLAESLADDVALDALAQQLQANELNVAAAVETVLRSERFFADENIAAVIASPPQYAIGAVRALECLAPPPSTLLLADWMARMGLDLFYPPNVGGWPQGKAWIASGSIVARANFAAALVEGRLNQSGAAPDFQRLVDRHLGSSDLPKSIGWLGELLFGGLPAEAIAQIVAASQANVSDNLQPLSAAVVILLSRPEAHLA